MAEKPLTIKGPERIERHTESDGGPSGILSRISVKALGIVGVLILVVVAGWFYMNRRAAQENEDASIALSRVSSYLDKGDLQKAIEGDPNTLIDGRPVQGLASIVSDYGSTDAGKLAALKLGESYLATGQVDEAKSAFEIATDADEPMFQAAATASLASVAEEKDNHAEAAKLYDEAASLFDSDVSRPLYLFAAAQNFELANQQEEAIERYRKIAIEYPTSEQNNVARFALARYGKEI